MGFALAPGTPAHQHVALLVCPVAPATAANTPEQARLSQSSPSVGRRNAAPRRAESCHENAGGSLSGVRPAELNDIDLLNEGYGRP